MTISNFLIWENLEIYQESTWLTHLGDEFLVHKSSLYWKVGVWAYGWRGSSFPIVFGIHHVCKDVTNSYKGDMRSSPTSISLTWEFHRGQNLKWNFLGFCYGYPTLISTWVMNLLYMDSPYTKGHIPNLHTKRLFIYVCFLGGYVFAKLQQLHHFRKKNLWNCLW